MKDNALAGVSTRAAREIYEGRKGENCEDLVKVLYEFSRTPLMKQTDSPYVPLANAFYGGRETSNLGSEHVQLTAWLLTKEIEDPSERIEREWLVKNLIKLSENLRVYENFLRTA